MLEILTPTSSIQQCLSTENNHISFRETIISENYHTLIMNFISLFEVDEQKQGIMANTAHSTMQMICNFFGDCIIL
jgi:hypothetical protein